MRDFVLLRRYRRQWTPKTRHAFCIFVGAHGERLSIDARIENSLLRRRLGLLTANHLAFVAPVGVRP